MLILSTDRFSSDDDVEFLESYATNKKWNRNGIFIEESNLPLRAHKAKVMQRMSRQGPNGLQVSELVERDLQTAARRFVLTIGHFISIARIKLVSSQAVS